MAPATEELRCLCIGACTLSVTVSADEAEEIQNNDHHVPIVSGCPNGPAKFDRLVEERDGYDLYRERPLKLS